MWTAALILTVLVSLPPLSPPVCRGKTFDGYDPRQDRAPGARAVAEIQTAYDVLCPSKQCGTGEVFENPTIGNNAMTWVSGLRDGARTHAKIVYSAQFLDGVAGRFGAGASFGVLAHEVGHHLTAALALRKMNRFESSWDEELRADYLAGCALSRSGHSPDDLERALRALAAVATPSHPAFGMRTAVVRKGYSECLRAPAPAKNAQTFGLGAALRARGKKKGCWGYWFRDPAEVARVGPIAAPRSRSRSFSDGAECERQRRRFDPGALQNSESCTCE